MPRRSAGSRGHKPFLSVRSSPMRSDMAKVIVERPRIKARKSKQGRAVALEDLPSHEGMRRAQALRGDRKQLNENLNPLKRYLAGQVGRPWRKVYGEIARNLR